MAKSVTSAAQQERSLRHCFRRAAERRVMYSPASRSPRNWAAASCGSAPPRGWRRTWSGRPGIDFRGIPAGKLRRYVSFRNFSDMAKTVAGIFASLKILARERPAPLFSKGGLRERAPRHCGAAMRNSFMDSRIRFRSRACHQDQPAFLRKGARFLLTDRRLSSGPVSEQGDRHRQPRAQSPLPGRCRPRSGLCTARTFDAPGLCHRREAWVPRSSTA